MAKTKRKISSAGGDARRTKGEEEKGEERKTSDARVTRRIQVYSAVVQTARFVWEIVHEK